MKSNNTKIPARTRKVHMYWLELNQIKPNWSDKNIEEGATLLVEKIAFAKQNIQLLMVPNIRLLQYMLYVNNIWQ